MNHILFFGYGYVASNLSKLLTDFKITGTKREAKLGLMRFDDLLEIESDITHILISIPPVNGEDITYNRFASQISRLQNLKWIGYLSSTGVYGNHNGDWVNENSATLPTNERSKNRLNSENKWLSLYKEYNIPVIIFRLSGIYGIGRNPLERLIMGENIDLIKADNIYFSRIHIEDIVNILRLSINNVTSNEIFNLADDYPCENFEVVEYAYNILNKTLPAYKNLYNTNLTPMMKEFYSDNKRVSNQKVKDILKIELKYQTYKEGLKSIKNQLESNSLSK